MKHWSRENTKQWISQLENRIKDMQFYLSITREWCVENEIYDGRLAFVCSIMTLIWVSRLRNEQVSKHELFEILGIKNWETVDDAVFEITAFYEDMELEELLRFVVSSFL